MSKYIKFDNDFGFNNFENSTRCLILSFMLVFPKYMWVGSSLRIISIFSLNVKESNALNETGKIEAHRAGHAYMLNWVNQNS